MKRIILAALIWLAGAGAFAARMTPEKLAEVGRLGEFKVSPNGAYVVYTVGRPDLKDNGSGSSLFIQDVSGGPARRIDVAAKSVGNVEWSGDGKSIYYTTGDNDSVIFYIDVEGKKIKKIATRKGGIANFVPGAGIFAFTADVKLDSSLRDLNPDLPKLTAMAYDELPVRHWDHWIDESYSHVFIQRDGDEKALDIMPGERYDSPLAPFGGREEIAISPDGLEIAYTSKKVSDYATSTNSSVYLYDVRTGATREMTPNMPGYDMDPMYSPDGKWIAFHSQSRPGYESDKIRIMLYDRATGKITELTRDIDQWAHNTKWSPDSRYVYMSADNDKGTSQIYRISVPDGKYDILTSGDFNYGDQGIQVGPKGDFILFTRRNYNRPSEIYKLDLATRRVSKFTNINDEIWSTLDTCRIESRWVESAGGEKVFCWVMYPPDFDANKKYPVITYCQGGPQQAVNQFWSYGWNFLTMASKGYIVLAPSRRGVPGFGQKWVDAINQNYGGEPMEDIMNCTKALAKEPYVDSKKLAAVGGSAGGYATFWLEGVHNGLYSAFISHCGLFDMVSMYGSTEELWFPNWDNGGAYWANRDYYEKISPHNYVKNWKTPILIITGEKDYRVPYTQSLEAFTAARSMGVPARLLFLPRENHWVLHPQEQILWYREFFNFLSEHMR